MTLRLAGSLRELRIHLCQTSKHSEGVRNFIKKHYVNIKKDNPNFPILIRECNGIQPRVWVRFGFRVTPKRLQGVPPTKRKPESQHWEHSIEKGVERSVPLTDQSADNVLAAVKQLVK